MCVFSHLGLQNDCKMKYWYFSCKLFALLEKCMPVGRFKTKRKASLLNKRPQ